MNTGCINRLNHVPKSCNLAPSNTPKNTKKKWFSISLEIKLIVLLLLLALQVPLEGIF